MICPNCGGTIPDGNQRCIKCGQVIQQQVPQQPQQGYQQQQQLQQHNVPRCTNCGYIGVFNKPPLIYTRDLVISIVLFVAFGAGIIWFIISVLQKKPMTCPRCKAAGTDIYHY